MAVPHILVVEDEASLSLLLQYNLEAEGYTVDIADRGDEAELKLRETNPDLVLLDWMLPGVSGIELCRRIRARAETATLPVIMLTARGEEAERIRGLSTGADDYIVKPFSVPELVARVGALLRRAKPKTVSRILQSGDIELDRETHRVHRASRELQLGPTEFKLLEFFMQSPVVFLAGSNCSTVFGAMMFMWMNVPWMFMSAGCARPSIRAGPKIQSARCEDQGTL